MTTNGSVPAFASNDIASAAHALATALADARLGTTPRRCSDAAELSTYVAAVALEAGYLPSEVEVHASELDALLASDHPFLAMPLPEDGSVFAVLAGGKRPRVVSSSGISTVSRDDLVRALSAGARARAARMCDRVLREIPDALDERRLRDAVAAELRPAAPIARAFVLRPNVEGPIARMLGGARGVVPNLLRFAALATIQSVLMVGAWWLIGSLALDGTAGRGSLLGWALLSLTAALVQFVATSAVGRFTLRSASRLREGLLEQSLRLDPESIGAYGLGGLTVLSAQADGFLGGVLALTLATLGLLVNAVATVAVLAAAPNATFLIAAFFVAVAAILALGPSLVRRTNAVQSLRIGLTTDTVERMIGHRTRIVQQTAASWHDGEDDAVHHYAREAAGLDRLLLFMRAGPRVFYLACVLFGLPSLVTHSAPGALAATLGGIALGMLTLQALGDVVHSGANLHAIARAIAPLSGSEIEPRRTVGVAPSSEKGPGTPAIELRGVRFAHAQRAKPVLDDACARIDHGERVLIEGPSGSGKTTLATLVTGLRKPQSGLVLVRGLDQFSIGEIDLRRAIASAPQFYKNHVFSETLAYNLLLGRAWPPSPEDLDAADEVARELGLGPLLDRMPAGLFQHVGDSGWQLSHGEKSRVYLARTLLQRSDVVLLDETFGALDPSTLTRAMAAVEERAPTLVVVTHR